MIDIVTNVELEQAFGKREHIGWKTKVNDDMTTTNCATLSKLYDVVYGHALDNG